MPEQTIDIFFVARMKYGEVLFAVSGAIPNEDQAFQARDAFAVNDNKGSCYFDVVRCQFPCTVVEDTRPGHD